MAAEGTACAANHIAFGLRLQQRWFKPLPEGHLWCKPCSPAPTPAQRDHFYPLFFISSSPRRGKGCGFRSLRQMMRDGFCVHLMSATAQIKFRSIRCRRQRDFRQKQLHMYKVEVYTSRGNRKSSWRQNKSQLTDLESATNHWKAP